MNLLEKIMNLLKKNLHPGKWYIPVTEENQAELNSWWTNQALKSGWADGPSESLKMGVMLLSKHPSDNSYYWGGHEEIFFTMYPSYQKITLEQFRQITNPNPKP
jgi:hypothetical protein